MASKDDEMSAACDSSPALPESVADDSGERRPPAAAAANVAASSRTWTAADEAMFGGDDGDDGDDVDDDCDPTHHDIDAPLSFPLPGYSKLPESDKAARIAAVLAQKDADLRCPVYPRCPVYADGERAPLSEAARSYFDPEFWREYDSVVVNVVRDMQRKAVKRRR